MNFNQITRFYPLRNVCSRANASSFGKRRHLGEQQAGSDIEEVKRSRHYSGKENEQHEQLLTESRVAAQTNAPATDNPSTISITKKNRKILHASTSKSRRKHKKTASVSAPEETWESHFSKEHYFQKFGSAFEKILKVFHMDKDTFIRLVNGRSGLWEKINANWFKERANMPPLILLNLDETSADDLPVFEYIQRLMYSKKATEELDLLRGDITRCRCSCQNPTGCRDCNKKAAASKSLFLHYRDTNVPRTKDKNLMTSDQTIPNSVLFTIRCNPAICPKKDDCRHDVQKFKRHPLIVTKEPSSMGWRLRAAEDMPLGSVVGEYTGEVRLEIEESSNANSHAYEEGQFVIDAIKKGNEGRFLPNSCDPKCLVTHFCEHGRSDLLTIDYHAGLDGVKEKKKPENATTCLSISENCRGWLQEL